MKFKKGDRVRAECYGLYDGIVFTVGGYSNCLVLVEPEAEKTVANDPVNHPDHYTFRGGVEPIDFIVSNNLTFAEGSIIKYIYRWPKKGGVESLKKARMILDKLIAEQENRKPPD